MPQPDAWLSQAVDHRPRASRLPWARFPFPETCPAILLVRTAMAVRVDLTFPDKLVCAAGEAFALMALGGFLVAAGAGLEEAADASAAARFLR